MRSTLVATCFFAFAQIALGQSVPSNASADALTVRISADGVCHFLDTATACSELPRYLLSTHLAQNGHIHITVDRAAKIDLVSATLKSLDHAGFKKVGFVNKDFQ